MFSKAAFFEFENKRLREENRLLLACLLERAGHREAAAMLRGTGAIPPTEEQRQANRVVSTATDKGQADTKIIPHNFISRNWGAMAARLSEMTRPAESKESENV